MIPPGEQAIETKKCRLSGQDFVITDKDLEFYDKISPTFAGKRYQIPSPTLCPDERLRRRMCFRNERNLYKRICDKTGKEFISNYAPDAPYTVYAPEVWWADSFSYGDYARDFDDTKTLFDQFDELLRASPRMGLGSNPMSSENSAYTNYAGSNKNCYFVFTGGFNESCMYITSSHSCANCYDCHKVDDCELCFECTAVDECYSCMHCSFLSNCRDCFGCVGLSDQTHCVYNVQYSQEEYQKRLSEEKKLSYREVQEKVSAVRKNVVRKENENISCENCTGNYLKNCNEAHQCFESFDLHRAKYCEHFFMARDAYDVFTYGKNSELVYECHYVGNNMYKIFFCHGCKMKCSDIWYTWESSGSNNLFGCAGVKKGSYCVLNKSYSKKEYEGVCARVVDHMKSTGEWGEYFPHALSPFAYNETVAQEWFPLTQEEVLTSPKRWPAGGSLGVGWRDEVDKRFTGNAYQPLDIKEYREDVVGTQEAKANIDYCLQSVCVCEKSGRPYKLTKQELAFYIENDVQLPRLHSEERHKLRTQLTNHRLIQPSACDKCGKVIYTTYGPDRTEKVYCEGCSKKELY